jgi:hypothetical protein
MMKLRTRSAGLQFKRTRFWIHELPLISHVAVWRSYLHDWVNLKYPGPVEQRMGLCEAMRGVTP